MLKLLTETDGVSGDEERVRELIRSQVEPYCSSIEVDSMGNLICRKNGKVGKKTILLSAHMDEVGFIIKKITDDGYLSFESVGGIYPKILLSQQVSVNGVNGVISLKAVHLSTKEEREKPFKEDDLFIDIGAKSKAEAEKYVTVGDYCAFKSEYHEFGEDMVKAKALDDRAGCAILMDILKKETSVNLICCFVVQEEVGLRGAKTALYGLNPDFAIVVEGTTCNDLTGVSDERRVTKCGGGAAISVMDYSSVANSELLNMLVDTAEKNNIKWQYKASVRGGNDAGAISISGGGVKTASVSIPCRYIHSSVSVMNKGDYEAVRCLIDKFIEQAEEM